MKVFSNSQRIYLYLELTFLLAGFVQGDFTLSNIVIDGEDNAKIIDINRRGCPVGWEPPEVAALIESRQRISMYIGVKSDIFQLGMVLWALALQQDEPELQPRPLASLPQEIPSYYRALVGICLSDDPRTRCHTTSLLSMFPGLESDDHGRIYGNQPSDYAEVQYIDPANAVERDDIDNFRLMDSQTTERGGPAPSTGTHTYVNVPTDMSGEAYFFPRRGRSPPRSATEEHEPQPRVVTVSPERHYLEERQAGESVLNYLVNDFAVPHDSLDDDTIGGGEAIVHFDIEHSAGDDEHTNSGENRHAINFDEDSPEVTNRINYGVEDVSTSLAHEIVATQNVTTAVAGESASLINEDASAVSAVAPRDESEDVLRSVKNATESNTTVSKNYESTQIPAATVANEDFGTKGDATESHVASRGNEGEGALNATTTAMGNNAGGIQSVTEDNTTVDGHKNNGMVTPEIMSGDINYITANITEDRPIAPGGGIEQAQNVTVDNTDGDANSAVENTITDNPVLGGTGNTATGNDVAIDSTNGNINNAMENKMEDNTVLGGTSNKLDDVVTGNVVAPEEAVEQPVTPRDEVKECGEVTTEEFVILGLGRKHADDGVLATRDVTGKDTTVEKQDSNLGQTEAAFGDLIGIGGHSTLEHSEIPQGISDDDLMTDMR